MRIPAKTYRKLMPAPTAILCVCSLTIACSAEETLKQVNLEQGISILYPSSFSVANGKVVDGVMRNAKDSAASKELRKKVEEASLAFLATPDKKTMNDSISIVLMPPEVSQEELIAFDDAQKNQLTEMLFQSAAEQFKAQKIRVTKKFPPIVRKGAQLSYFLWAYEFTNASNEPKNSMRAYYYTSDATYLVTISCRKSYYDTNTKALEEAISSLKLTN